MVEERERFIKVLDQHGRHCKHGGHRVPSEQTAERETPLELMSQDAKSKFLLTQQEFQVNSLKQKLEDLISGDFLDQSDLAKALDSFTRTNSAISTDEALNVLRQIQSILGKPLANPPSSEVILVEEVEEAKEEPANAG